MSSAPSPVPARGWWRRNLGWLIGAAVLGTAAFVLPYRSAMRDLDNHTPRHRIDGTAKGTVYEGSRWRVVGVERKPGGGRAVIDYPHADGDTLLIRYEVIAGEGVDSKMLDRCKGRLVDADGRRWEANEPWKLQRRYTAEKMATNCGSGYGWDGKQPTAKPGQPFFFTHIYLVPAGTPLQGLRAEILLPSMKTTPPGSYLSFPLQPDPAR